MPHISLPLNEATTPVDEKTLNVRENRESSLNRQDAVYLYFLQTASLG
jgi:hypothetical protein